MASSEAISQPIRRVIDASFNRLGEGLRLLEDIARLQLNDASLTQQLKTMRHQLLSSDWPFNQQLIQARDAGGDVGIDIKVAGEPQQRELPAVVVANARRVQQSLRTLEEVAKIPGSAPQLDPERFQQARFELYTIEQNLLSKLLRRDKRQQITGLYVIIDTQALRGRSHLEVARHVISGGSKVIQLRDKQLGKKELLTVAHELRNLCAEHKVLFIVNDYLDIALATDADGLHLGQEDLPIKVARKLLPIDKILGSSVTTVDQATAAESEGADYIALGSIYPTASKETIKVVGLERLHHTRQAISLPLVALGGISKDNAAEVMSAGADSIAVISAVVGTESPQEATRELIASLETVR